MAPEPAEVARLKQRVAELESERQAAAEAQERLGKILEHSNDGILLVEPHRDAILEANRQVCRMLGYEREELLALPLSVLHPHEMDRVREFADGVFENGHGWTNRLGLETKSRSQLEAEMSASTVEIEGRPCLITMVSDVGERRRLAHENAYLQHELRAGQLVGGSAALRASLEQVRRVAPTDTTVLVTGESGTGKELFAAAIHEASPRADRVLVRVDCPSLRRDLFESEFFGHVQGAFTGARADRLGRFELADQGTIFLDEIAEIPLASQSKLLRVLQSGEFERLGESRTRHVDVRVIAATNRDLSREMREGHFREDLFYRLNVFPIQAPSLRERRQDLVLLAEHFVEKAARRLGREPPRLTREDARALEEYSWPGNVRELRNVIERATLLSRDGRLGLDLGDGQQSRPSARGVPPPGAIAEATLDDVRRMERDVIARALVKSGWKVYGDDGAAARLGLPATTLASRLKKMGLKRPGAAY